MKSLLNRETATGLLVTGFGLATTLYAQSHYKLGTFRTPGPGLFPTLVASALTVIGACLLIQSLVQRQQAEAAEFEYRPFLMVLLSIAAFAVIFPYAGYGPGVFALAVIAGFADTQLKFLHKLALAAVVTVIAVGLFRGILGVRLPILGMGGF